MNLPPIHRPFQPEQQIPRQPDGGPFLCFFYTYEYRQRFSEK